VIFGVILRSDLFGNFFRQHLSKLHAPLIKGIDVPDRTLNEDAVFIESDQFAQNVRRQFRCKEGRGGTVALEDAVGDQPVGVSFGFDGFA
jgi:hypothetical protein